MLGAVRNALTRNVDPCQYLLQNRSPNFRLGWGVRPVDCTNRARRQYQVLTPKV